MAAGIALGGLLAACATRHGPPTRARRWVPVDCSRERIVRRVAGLRPYRSSGYVVRTDYVDRKPIIHNYGHGGAGITLSWGTAQLALEQAQQTSRTRFAVIGSGVAGLTTARLLQRRGYGVTIYAASLPPDTTSDVACGWWAPVSVVAPGRGSAAFEGSFERACRVAHGHFRALIGDRYGVRWLPLYRIEGGAPVPPAGETLDRAHPWLASLNPPSRRLAPSEHPFAASVVEESWSMLIETPVFLQALLRDFRDAGGRIVQRRLASLAEIVALPEPAIVNCTGLGAAALFGDPELVPVKGQLALLRPQPEVDYAIYSVRGSLYMFPRRDAIVLGGTYEEGRADVEPDPDWIEEIVAGHAAVFGAMRRSG